MPGLRHKGGRLLCAISGNGRGSQSGAQLFITIANCGLEDMCPYGAKVFHKQDESLGKEGSVMKKWYPEDWRFKIEVIRVGKENKAEECRLGFEVGDTFECAYGTPANFCPTAYIKIFPALETARCGGDWRNFGAQYPHVMDFVCPDGAVLFKITAEQKLPSEESMSQK
jgi:uncharacterized repeat protein (TIGR04076 family)